MPFDEQLHPLPAGKTRPERTGKFVFGHCRTTEYREVEPGKFEDVPVGWDYERVETETRYECAHCGQEIEHRHLQWMLRRFWWVAHHAKAPRDHVSAHFWAAYSPFEEWGGIAKKFLLADGDAGALHDVYNSDFGLPFNPTHTEVVEDDILKLQKASPHYLLGSFPYEPEILTAAFDVQRSANNPYWYSIWAWGILWHLPGWPTFAALVDYGTAMSKDHVEELCALRPDAQGKLNRYRWQDPHDPAKVREYQVLSALMDSGDQAQHDAAVYDFCLEHSAVFSPSKGGGVHQTRGDTVRLSPVYGDRLTLLWYLDNYWKQRLYHHAIKARRYHRFPPRQPRPGVHRAAHRRTHRPGEEREPHLGRPRRQKQAEQQPHRRHLEDERGALRRCGAAARSRAHPAGSRRRGYGKEGALQMASWGHRGVSNGSAH